jgi:predicted acyl esterase
MIEERDIRVAMVAMRDGTRLAVETLSELSRD